jgi:hypothetical protein
MHKSPGFLDGGRKRDSLGFPVGLQVSSEPGKARPCHEPTLSGSLQDDKALSDDSGGDSPAPSELEKANENHSKWPSWVSEGS